MAEDNVKAQMRKGILEYCILAILSRGDSYAPRIIAELKAAEMIVVEGTLYPILTRAEKRRSAYLPLGRISSGASPQILHADRERPRSTPHARSSVDRDGTADRRDPSRRQTGRKPINRSPNEKKTLRLHAVAALRTTEGAVSDGGRRDMTTGGVESLRNHTRSIRNRHKPITP